MLFSEQEPARASGRKPVAQRVSAGSAWHLSPVSRACIVDLALYPALTRWATLCRRLRRLIQIIYA